MKKLFFMLLLLASPIMADDLQVELKVGTNVEDRNLVGESDNYPANVDQVVAWTMVKGAKEPIELNHVWTLDGRSMGKVLMPIRSSKYRVWSVKKIMGKTGRWAVDVQDLKGKSLARVEFIVGEKAP